MNMRGQKTILAPSVHKIKDSDVKEVLQFLIDAVEEINRSLRADIAAVNEVLPDSDDTAFYLGTKVFESTDPYSPYIYADGSWRIKKVGTRMDFEKKESGSWVRKGSMTP